MDKINQLLDSSGLTILKNIATNNDVVGQLRQEQEKTLTGIKRASNLLKTNPASNKSDIFTIVAAREGNSLLGSVEGTRESQQTIYKSVIQDLADNTRDFQLPRVLISACLETRSEIETLQKKLNASGQMMASVQNYLAHDPGQGHIVNKADSAYNINAKSIGISSNSTVFVNTPAYNLAATNIVEQYSGKHTHGDIRVDTLENRYSIVHKVDVQVANNVFRKAEECLEDFAKKYYLQAEETIELKAKKTISLITKELNLQGVKNFVVNAGADQGLGQIKMTNGDSGFTLKPGLIDLKAGCLTLSSDCQIHLKSAGDAVLSGGSSALLGSFGETKMSGSSVEITALIGPAVGSGEVHIAAESNVKVASLKDIVISGILKTDITSGAVVNVKAGEVNILASTSNLTSLGPQVITGYPVLINCGASGAAATQSLGDIAATTAETTALIAVKKAELAINVAKATALLAAATGSAVVNKTSAITAAVASTNALDQITGIDINYILTKAKVAAKAIKTAAGKVGANEIKILDDALKGLETIKSTYDAANTAIKTARELLVSSRIMSDTSIKVVDTLRQTTPLFLPNPGAAQHMGLTGDIEDIFKVLEDFEKIAQDKLSEFEKIIKTPTDLEKKFMEAVSFYNLTSKQYANLIKIFDFLKNENTKAQTTLNKINANKAQYTDQELLCAQTIVNLAQQQKNIASVTAAKFKNNNVDPLAAIVSEIQNQKTQAQNVIKTAKNLLTSSLAKIKEIEQTVLDLIKAYNDLVNAFTYNPVPPVKNNYNFRPVERIIPDNRALGSLKQTVVSQNVISDSKDFIASSPAGVGISK